MKFRLFYYIVIASGITLRLIWVSDMEWKGDEKWMYAKAHEVAKSGTFPAVGMLSGGGIVNPGISVAAFAVIAQFTDDPLSMDRVVQILNVVALLCFLLFALSSVNEAERDIWIAGIALAAVSPLAVLFSRKIWAQDILPIFSFLVILGNAHRKKNWGAFIWGLIGALIGQIHMSGFFFTAGIFLYTVFYDRYHKHRILWPAWIAGSLLGALPMVPWIIFLINNPHPTNQNVLNAFYPFFFVIWLLDTFGVHIFFSMRGEFFKFLREPVIAGIPTYLISLAHLFLGFTGALAIWHLWEYAKNTFPRLKKNLWKYLFDSKKLYRFYLFSILLGLGVIMTLSATPVWSPYLICAFPFSYIFLAWIFHERHRALFRAIIIVQFFITATFLLYVHMHDGIPGGDYGRAYHAQTE